MAALFRWDLVTPDWLGAASLHRHWCAACAGEVVDGEPALAEPRLRHQVG
ncbi:hypothetical protein [Lentzea flaviverrucosa]|nr:hypothetical protein [Lentzea flaviverrucosa]